MSELRAVRLPFGKHKGELVSEVALNDRGYLHWLRENTDLRGEVLDAVELALGESDDPGAGWERFGSGWRKR